LTVQLNSNAADHIEEIFIVNALGQIVKRENINLLKGKNIFRMDTYAIPNGIYFIQFSDSIIDQQTIKFIKN
jgi:hypothetical protein